MRDGFREPTLLESQKAIPIHIQDGPLSHSLSKFGIKLMCAAPRGSWLVEAFSGSLSLWTFGHGGCDYLV